MQKLHRGPLPTYPEEEDALYMAFINLRKNQGFPVDGYWLRAEMGNLLTLRYGSNHGFALSNGWLTGFLLRYEISDQLRTEKKYQSALERKFVIDQFFLDIRHIQTQPWLHQCPVWGAFPPSSQWNADHCPIPFVVNFKRSLNSKNTPCWIAHLGTSGLDKRQATIHLW
jgi:hypothetical protein